MLLAKIFLVVLIAVFLLSLRKPKKEERESKDSMLFVLVITLSILIVLALLDIGKHFDTSLVPYQHIMQWVTMSLVGLFILLVILWPFVLLVNVFGIIATLSSYKTNKNFLWIYLICLVLNVVNVFLLQLFFADWQPA
jgi:multisubunit Na+/H+ antiporter MnhB subunit